MSANTSIQWTNKTWNPIAAFLKRDITIEVGGKKRVIPKGTRGWFCIKVSPGCANCYAEAINLRLGNGLTYLHRNLDDIEFRLVNLKDPLKWRKPCMVFVNSMTDLFLEHIPDEMIDMVFSVMAMAGRHTFQVLTKRHVRMRDYMVRLSKNIKPLQECARSIGYTFKFTSPLDGKEYSTLPWPIQNVWLGVSVEDQTRADERIPLLLQTPAAIRFLSCEPLLGPIDLKEWLDIVNREFEPLHWVIIGGESGKRARECKLIWIRDIVKQCLTSEVSVFVKQLGAKSMIYSMKGSENDGWYLIRLKDSHGGDIEEWPEDLRVREFPKVEVAA